jgi:methyl-accepting chemotaxis protein/methyl-accepting chemotaxis protein-1 (serine sensor receptor)
LKLSVKLYGTVGALALVGFAVAGEGVWSDRALCQELTEATERTAVKLDLVNAARARAWEMVASLRGMYVFSNLNDSAALEATSQRYRTAYRSSLEQIEQLKPLLVTEQGKSDLSRFESMLGAFRTVSAEYERMCRDRKFAEVAQLIAHVQEFTGEVDPVLMRLRDQQREFLERSQARTRELKSESMALSGAMVCLLMGIAIPSGLVVRNVNRTLTVTVRDISMGAEQLAAASNQISSASQSLAQGASEQAASIEETSAASEQVNSMARRNSENSQTALGLVGESQESFTKTNRSLDQMVLAMREIDVQSGNISRIIKTIDGIAFQTNILALNASVEAARAGRAGLGFAVVADEVRNLAQRCAQAARETADLIEASIAKSHDGMERVTEVSTAIRAATEQSGQVGRLVGDISTGSREQLRGVDQVARTIQQIEQVTQQAAANAEQTAAAAEELNAQSDSMREIVGKLALMVGGDASLRTARTATGRGPQRRLPGAPASQSSWEPAPSATWK